MTTTTAVGYQTIEGLTTYWEARREHSLRHGPADIGAGWSDEVYSTARDAVACTNRRALALDYGTGAGFFVPLLLEVADEVVAADLGPAALEFIAWKFGGEPVRPQKVDAVGNGVEGHPDLVFMNSVLIHLPDEIAMELFGNLRAVAAEGATWVIGEPPCVADMSRAAKHDPERVWWIYPRSVDDVQRVTGLSVRRMFLGRVCYLVLE